MSNDYFSNSNNSGNCSSSRWLTEEVFKLIDIVKKDEAIYNPRHKYYFCRPYVENFWREVDLKLEKNPGSSLAKWTNLRISFRREYTNYLEEKLPPCWTYFDSMFFLHPYLRKKQLHPKSLDSQVQDALVHINSLSTHLQRERVAASTVNAAAMNQILTHSRSIDGHPHSSTGNTENYLEYFDNPDQNNSELDEMIDNEEHPIRFQNIDSNSLNNDIKSECDDVPEDYEDPQLCERKSPENLVEDDHDADEVLNFAWDSMASSGNSSALIQGSKRQHKQHYHDYQQQRLEHLQRLQTRSYHEELRTKRPRSNESISSTHTCHQRSAFSSSTTSANVSFVRPTFTTKPADVVSTTTTANGSLQRCNDSSEVPSTTNQVASSSVTTHQQTTNRHQPQTKHQQNDLSSNSPVSATNNINNNSIHSVASTNPTSHVDLCDCKSDPDAMFLMSLLPDIQKLNGRDRGKIKIAFQNILQDYLYPD